jgi:hypothetical protein
VSKLLVGERMRTPHDFGPIFLFCVVFGSSNLLQELITVQTHNVVSSDR